MTHLRVLRGGDWYHVETRGDDASMVKLTLRRPCGVISVEFAASLLKCRDPRSLWIVRRFLALEWTHLRLRLRWMFPGRVGVEKCLPLEQRIVA